MARSSRSGSSRSGTVARSAITGRFVKPATAARHPRTTIVSPAGGAGGGSGTTHRSAITGRFVKPATAARHPATTVTHNR